MKSFIMPFVKFILPLLVFLGFTACETEVKEPLVYEPHARDLFHDYFRKKELKAYLSKEFNVDLGAPKTDTILFIPLNSCDKCVQKVLISTQKNEFPGLIVFAGDIQYKPAFKEMYSDIINNKYCLIDTSSVFNKYNIDVFTPTLIILSGKQPRFSLIDFQNWKKVCKTISWKL